MSVNVSVAMAVYNGENYLKEQLDSILSQLDSNDELIISYNESTDNTLNIINEYAEQDNRIHFFECKQKGIISNFENALRNVNGKYIFLCDQDDIWNPEKVRIMSDALKEKNVVLAMHNCEYINSYGEHIDGDLFVRRKARTGLMKNLIKNCYQGSCMAFKNTLLEYIIPIPTDIAMHDQWIGLVAERKGKVCLIDKPLIKYRRHSTTASDVNVSLPTKTHQAVKLYSNLIRVKKK